MLASLFQLTVREDALAGGVTVTYKGRTIVASADQPMASVNGRVVTLPAPVARVGRRLFVPIDFLPRALAPIYDSPIDLRRASRLLIVGTIRVARVVVAHRRGGTADARDHRDDSRCFSSARHSMPDACWCASTLMRSTRRRRRQPPG